MSSSFGFLLFKCLDTSLDQGERVRLLFAVPETRVLDQVTQTMTEEVKFQSPSKESEDRPLVHRVTPSDKLKWVIVRNWLRRHFCLGRKRF